MRAIYVNPGELRPVDGMLPATDQIRALQTAIGGWVQPVQTHNGDVIFWCDEDGKVRDLPINELATAYWWLLTPEAVNVDTLCGNVVITGTFDKDETILPIPDRIARLFMETFVEGT